MTQKRPTPSLFGDLSALLLTSVTSQLARGITNVIFTNYLGPTKNGILGLAFSYATFIFYLTDFGFNQVLVRELTNASQDRQSPLVWTSLRSRLTLTVVASLLVILIARLLPGDKQSVELTQQLVLASAVPGMLIAWTEAVMNGSNRVALSAYIRFAASIAVALATGLTMLTGGDFSHYVLFQSIGNWLVALPCLIWVWQRYPLSTKMDPALFRDFWVFGIWGILLVLLPRVSAAALPFSMKYAAIGAFLASSRLPEMLYFVPQNITTAFFPRMFKAWPMGEAEHSKVVLNFLRVGSLITGVLAVGFIVISDQVAAVLFPKFKDWPMGLSMAILMIVPWIQSQNLALTNALGTSERQRMATTVMIICVPISFLMYLLLSRYLGITGAALAAVGTECGLLIGYLISNRPSLVGPAMQQMLKHFFAVMAAASAGLLLRQILPLPELPEAILVGLLAALLFVWFASLADNQLRIFIAEQIANLVGRRNAEAPIK